MVDLSKAQATSVAVIGAGMAGLTCARALQDSGFDVVVFDKSRGLGGRLATRRTQDGLSFDHGAQYVTAQGDGFRALLQRASDDGSIAPWHPRGREAAKAWFIGRPTMNALVKPLAEGLDLRRQTSVQGARRLGERWNLTGEDGRQLGEFDVLVSTVPAPQAAVLLTGEAAVQAALAAVVMAPCWALLAAFDTPLAASDDVLRDHPAGLSWVARNSAKPARGGAADCWVAHANPEWSLRQLEAAPEEVCDRLMEMLRQALELTTLPRAAHATAHRWRYARTTVPLGRPCLSLPDRGLYLGGDWCLGARVECAFDSGQAIARQLGAPPAA